MQLIAEIFPWNENFETGIAEIDLQHQKIAHLINVLANHVAHQSDVLVLGSVFTELTDYAASHFRDEEAIWRSCMDSAGIEKAHAQEHTRFVETIGRLMADQENMPLEKVVEDILMFLTHWLAYHILDSDKRMAIVVLGIRSGLSLDEAKSQAKEQMSGSTQVLIDTLLSMYDTLSARTMELMREVGERQKAEIKLADAKKELEIRSEELMRVNEELEQFAYVASHDLRQPLRMVSSYLKMIRDSMGTDLGGEVGRYFGFAVDGATRMDRMIVHLLEYSREGRNAGPLKLLPLAEVVAEARQNLGMAIQEAGAVITVQEGLPAVYGDHGELVRLFQNLVGNAVKYRAPDRSVAVEIGWRDGDGKDEWIVWVKDNGIGMAPEHHERVFHIFQRLHGDHGSYEGAGIGLAICKKIAQAHGGRIWLESQLGQGACFYLAFPKKLA